MDSTKTKHLPELRADGAGDSTIESHLDDCSKCRAVASSLDLPEPSAEGVRSMPSTVVAGQHHPDPDLGNLPPGFEIGPYTIVRLISSGGLGHVYQAHEAGQFALKFLKNQYSYNYDAMCKNVRTELIMQADQMRRVRSEYVAVVNSVWVFRPNNPAAAERFDPAVGVRDGWIPFAVMEYVERGTLDKRALVTRWTVLRDVMLQVVDGLRSIHASGVVHLDIKPSNVLLAEDRLRPCGYCVKITDIGIRSFTPAYAAPEVERGDTPRPSADLYSLGATLFEKCTGKRYATIEGGRIVRLDAAAVRKSMLRSPCGKLFLNIVQRCLEEDLSARYASAEEVYGDLEKVKPPWPTWQLLLVVIFFCCALAVVGAVLRSNKASELRDWAQVTLPDAAGDVVVVEQVASEEASTVQSERERKTGQAWEAFKKGETLFDGGDKAAAAEDLERARRIALSVLRSKGAAIRLQRRLTEEKTPLPPEGHIADETLKKEIFSWGQLNDVAVCLWIIGRASEYLDELDFAMHSYRQGAKLSYARTWDPDLDILWSPAIKCSDDIVNLTEIHPELPSVANPRSSYADVLLFTGVLGALAVLSFGVWRDRSWLLCHAILPFERFMHNAA